MATNRKRLAAFRVVMAAILLIGASFTISSVRAASGEKAEMMTIMGTVVELDQNADGTVAEALILTDTEGDFLIIKDIEKGNELMQKTNKTVEVTGAVQESDEGRKEIIVHSYTIVESE